MGKKTTVFSLIEQQASSLLAAAAGSYNLCAFFEKDEEKTVVFSRWYAGAKTLYGSAATPNVQKLFRKKDEHS